MSVTQTLTRTSFWAIAHLTIALCPLLLAMTGSPPKPRGLPIAFDVALGLIGYSMLGLHFLTTSRFRPVAPYFGADAEISFHRLIGIIAVAVVLAHPAILILSKPEYTEFFDPRVNLPRAVALSSAVVFLILVVVLSVWRTSFWLNYEWWRLTHGLLAVGSSNPPRNHGTLLGSIPRLFPRRHHSAGESLIRLSEVKMTGCQPSMLPPRFDSHSVTA